MAAGPVGTSWKPGSWSNSAWKAGAWADRIAQIAHGQPFWRFFQQARPKIVRHADVLVQGVSARFAVGHVAVAIVDARVKRSAFFEMSSFVGDVSIELESTLSGKLRRYAEGESHQPLARDLQDLLALMHAPHDDAVRPERAAAIDQDVRDLLHLMRAPDAAVGPDLRIDVDRELRDMLQSLNSAREDPDVSPHQRPITKELAALLASIRG